MPKKQSQGYLLGTQNSEATSRQVNLLKKGTACVSCRRRKMRCDGVRPVCGSCIGTTKAEDCEYITGSQRTSAQRLEDEIKALEEKLRYLQSSSSHSSRTSSGELVDLQQPYYTIPYSSGFSSGNGVFDEPPQDIMRKLLNTFLAHSSQYGFFLHPARFKKSVLLPGPPGDYPRPSSALLATTYLLGIHFSQDTELKRFERNYLQIAAEQTAQITLPSSTYSKHLLHTIQAEVLLSYYFFANNRTLECEYHLSSAFSIALATKLFQLSARNPVESPLLPATDIIEEEERIGACWAVLCLDSLWAVVSGRLSNTSRLDNGGRQWTTTWFRDMIEYEADAFRARRRLAPGLAGFLAGENNQEEKLHTWTFYIQAVSILDRICTMAKSYQGTTDQRLGEPSWIDYYQLRNLAMNLKASLPPLEACLKLFNADVSLVFVGYNILNICLTQIHTFSHIEGKAVSQKARVMYAEEIFDNTIHWNQIYRQSYHLNPIMGFVWKQAFDVLLIELKAEKITRLMRVTIPSEVEDTLSALLHKGVSTFATYATTVACPYISVLTDNMLDTLACDLDY